MKKSVIQTHRWQLSGLRPRLEAAGWPCPQAGLAVGWGPAREGGPSTEDCETGRVSVSLRGSHSRGSGGTGLSGRQQGDVWGC